jgi:hypothetical protein
VIFGGRNFGFIFDGFGGADFGSVSDPPVLEIPAEFNSYTSQARKAALYHFGESIVEIESILSVSSSDWNLRDDLAWTLWHYARGKAQEDGSWPERSAQVHHHIKSFAGSILPLREDAAAHTAMLMLGIDVPEIFERLETTLFAAGNADRGGRPADVEYGLLMGRVVYIFELATTEQAGLTWDWHKETFTGKFFRVAELVNAAAASATEQPPKTNIALGKFLQRLLQSFKP